MRRKAVSRGLLCEREGREGRDGHRRFESSYVLALQRCISQEFDEACGHGYIFNISNLEAYLLDRGITSLHRFNTQS